MFFFCFFMWNKKSKVHSKIDLLTEKWAEEEKKGNLNRGKKAEINQTWFCAHVLFIQVLQMQPTSTSRLFSCNKKPLAKHEKGFWKNKKFWREHLLCWESQRESGCKIFPCEHLNGSAGFTLESKWLLRGEKGPRANEISKSAIIEKKFIFLASTVAYWCENESSLTCNRTAISKINDF